MFVTVIIFIVILSLLVFVHEFGHFVVAKRSGMRVHEFGFGFPPRVIGIQKANGKWTVIRGRADAAADATVYSINAIPLGGFVKIMGEDNDSADDPRAFTSKPFFARLATLAAGVIMNFVLAAVLLSIGFMYGLPIAVDSLDSVPAKAQFATEQIAILEVQPDSPAAQVGLQDSDLIQSIDGLTFTDISDLQSYVKNHQGQPLAFQIKRVNEVKTVTVQTNDQGVVGIGLALYGKLRFSPPLAVIEGTRTAYYQLTGIVSGLYKLFSAGEGLKSLGGPVKIAQLTGQVADLGIIPLIQFSAFLSLNLAVLNTLPFPALDGGRILFLLIEKVRGKRNNQAVEQYANAIGFFLLLLLMAVITVRDVSQIQSIKNLFS